eukprot:299980-Chlamydomonas_euryale.AAC.2
MHPPPPTHTHAPPSPYTHTHAHTHAATVGIFSAPAGVVCPAAAQTAVHAELGGSKLQNSCENKGEGGAWVGG